MRIAAIHSPEGKIFGTTEGDQFAPFVAEGIPVRDLRDVISLVSKFGSAIATGVPVALETVRLAAPVGPLAKNVVCVGKNYHEHAKEFARSDVDQSGDKQEAPEFPVVFTKAVTSLADPFAEVSTSLDPTNSVDYEGELGVVIGRSGKNIKKADALDFVFGYTIVNDFTARTIQTRHRQWFLGKSLDGFCPVGPCLVTADEFGVPDGQELSTRVNDELRQYAPLRDLTFDVGDIIEAVSACVPLDPGDLIATGTPAGVGIGFSPQRFLQPGDVVRVSISGIGELVNPIV